MTRNPIITLTTDFGHKGPFVAVMKGVILQHAPDARIIDLTHEILVHWPAEAGFWLARSYRYFPAGTVHVAVVDPGVGTERNIIAVELDGHVFLAPDNGLLPTEMPTLNSVILPSAVIRPIWATSVSENQILPSGPVAMASGPAFKVGRSNSLSMPSGVMQPILLARFCANHRLPSAPRSIPIGVASAVGKANSRNVALRGSKQPTLAAPLSQNQRFRSGPSTQI